MSLPPLLLVLTSILTTMPDNHIISDVGQIALSDHYIIFTCVNCNVTNSGHKMARFRDYRDFNSDKFIEDICNCDILANDLNFFYRNII